MTNGDRPDLIYPKNITDSANSATGSISNPTFQQSVIKEFPRISLAAVGRTLPRLFHFKFPAFPKLALEHRRCSDAG
jgi:hypothetical protein